MLKKSLLMIAGMLFASALYAENFLRNGDFSQRSIAPWVSPQTGYKKVHTIKDGQLQITGDTKNKYNGFITLVQNLPDLEQGKQYLLRAKVKAGLQNVAGKYAKIVIRQADANGRGLGYSGITVDLSNNTWKDYTFVFTPHPQGVKFQLYIQSSNFGDDEFILVDDVEFGPVPELQPEGSNLVLNGNFEHFLLIPWKSAFLGRNDKFFQLSGDTAFGSQCLVVSGDKNHRYNNFITMLQDLPKLDSDKEYILSARIRAGLQNIQGKKVEVAVRQVTAEGRSINYVTLSANLSDDSWQYLELMFKPSKLAASFQLYIIVSGLESSDLAAIDNIVLRLNEDAAAPFDPAAAVQVPTRSMTDGDVTARIDTDRNLLHSLTIDGVTIQPGAGQSTVVAVEKDGSEIQLDGKNTPAGGFRATATYEFADGMFREIVVIEALQDFNTPVKLSVRHGFDRTPWQKHIGALRPLRVLPIDQPTIFSYLSDTNDLNPGILDQYQHCAYPLMILEGQNHYLIAGSRNFDQFVTLAPNRPMGYLPSWQRNPKTVKKGDTFRFETNWKLFSRQNYMLRDVWRFYIEHLQTNNPVLQQYLPARFTEPRHFYPGPFCAHTYFLAEREERTPDGANIWFYSWHDNIRERYPISGEWWSDGNTFREKINAEYLREYMRRLQTERKFNLIMYLRQLANLHERERGAFPESWYKTTPGGALHLYGGGYKFRLPSHVAAEVGYDYIQWGQHNFANPDFRAFYLKEIFDAINFYQPRAIGWDMGSDFDEFSVIAETYTRLRNAGGHVKAVANEGAGPTQLYVDMVLLENGLLGGKSAYDFEINRAFTTSLVCLERFNIFQLAFEAHTTGRKVWLADAGLRENKRYFDYIRAKRPDIKDDKIKIAQLCQLRASIFDLALGASPGYMEEARPVPPTLMQVAGDVNGLFMINKSFSVMFPNRSNVDGHKIVSAWKNDSSFRLVAFNDTVGEAEFTVLLDRSYFNGENWTLADIRDAVCKAVTPEGESDIAVEFSENEQYITLKFRLGSFTALILSADK